MEVDDVDYDALLEEERAIEEEESRRYEEEYAQELAMTEVGERQTYALLVLLFSLLYLEFRLSSQYLFCSASAGKCQEKTELRLGNAAEDGTESRVLHSFRRAATPQLSRRSRASFSSLLAARRLSDAEADRRNDGDFRQFGRR